MQNNEPKKRNDQWKKHWGWPNHETKGGVLKQAEPLAKGMILLNIVGFVVCLLLIANCPEGTECRYFGKYTISDIQDSCIGSAICAALFVWFWLQIKKQKQWAPLATAILTPLILSGFNAVAFVMMTYYCARIVYAWYLSRNEKKH